MNCIVSLKEVIDGLDMIGDEVRAYLNLTSGEVLEVTQEDLDTVEEGEEWREQTDLMLQHYEKVNEIISTENWLELPSKFDIHEYKIMEDFCLSVEHDGIRDELLWKIRGSGAFRRFRDTIYHYSIEADWYAFRGRAFRQIAVDWLEEHDIAYTDGDDPVR
jgi:hypothetical protein